MIATLDLKMEQPYSFTATTGVFFSQTFISHSGAVAGQHLSVSELRLRLEEQAGPGELIHHEDGQWYWRISCECR